MPDDSGVTSAERRSFDRLVNFTDAVVAIGITLQLLPLIDVAGPQAGQSVWEVIAANQGQITAFILSFVVVIAMWSTHNRVFNSMRRYDGTIFTLNVMWLLLIVFLPWPTAMYGNAVNDQVIGSGGVGLLYWWTLAAISGLGSLIALHAGRTPELLEPDARAESHLYRSIRRWTGLSFFVAFASIGILSEFLPGVSPYVALLLIPLNHYLRRRSDAISREAHGLQDSTETERSTDE